MKPPRRTSASRSVATTAPERGAAAISIRSSHSLRGSSTVSRRSIMRWVWRALAACFSLASLRNLRPILSLSSPALRLGVDALVHPGALHLGAVLEGGALVGVLLVLVPGVPAGHLAFLQVGVVAAAVEVDPLLGEVEFEDLGDGAGEELAVVADDDRAGAQAGDEPFEAFQAVQVEVVVGSSMRKTS
ncbi:hypothetical protein SFUMM280S_09418 [Streptomyces fumanus]